MPVFALRGSDYAPGAVGTIVVSRDGEHGALVVDGLGTLNPGQQYQLWLIRKGVRTSGGVFSVDIHGYATMYVRITAAVSQLRQPGDHHRTCRRQPRTDRAKSHGRRAINNAWSTGCHPNLNQ